MQQIDAFKRTVPQSSKLAEIGHSKRGKRQGNCAKLEAFVLLHPGMTSLEIAHATGMDRHEVSRRLADLKNDGRATQGVMRKCHVNGHAMLTWRVEPPKGE